MRPAVATAILFALALVSGAPAAASAPRVVVSIAPLHSLVSAITGDRTEPHLIVPAGQSPHTFSLAPSDARALARADIVFSAGGETDRFLERPLDSLAGKAAHASLLEMDGVRTLEARTGGAWRHAHGDEAEGEHGDGHGSDHDQGHHDEHGHEGEDDGATHTKPAGAAIDPHAWLDPRNAIAFIRAAVQRLADLDPEHADTYHGNAEAAIKRIKRIDRQLAEQLEPLTERPYLVFHDAYQYFERRYGLSPAGSIVVDPGRPPGARRVSELRDRIETLGALCLFVEPQFEPRIARSIAEGTGARVAELDPLGADLAPGPDLYPNLLRRLGDSLSGCLAAGGDD